MADYKELPEIYAVEATNACDLQCPMCLRTSHMHRKPKLFELDLLDKMIKRGDFGGSYFVELQQAGEPTIHPDLKFMIDMLKDQAHVLVGLSTHGLNFTKMHKVEACLRLDAITISVDSLDEETYHRMRYPAHVYELTAALDHFFEKQHREPFPKLVELQLVEAPQFTSRTQEDKEKLQELIQSKGWRAEVRVTSDSFIEMQGRGMVEKPETPFCINPWMSVNVGVDGRVTSCCYIFEPDEETVNYYGDLRLQSLKEIWGGKKVKEMRCSQRTGQLKDQCTKCYQTSPTLIHSNIVSRLVRLGGSVK